MYYYLGIGICVLTIFLKYCLKRKIVFFTPIVMFSASWMLSSIMMIFVMHRDYLRINTIITNFDNIGRIILSFEFFGILGCLMAYVFVGSRQLIGLTEERKCDFLNKAHYILSKFFFILILNGILGIFRFIIVFRHGMFSSFAEYRQFAALDLYLSLSWIEKLLFQISNHVYILSGFYIVIFGATLFLEGKWHWRNFIWNFLLFSIPLMSTGGRLWILNFIGYFYSGYFFAYSLDPLSRSAKSAIKVMSLMLLIFAVVICAISWMRGEQKFGKENTFMEKLGYVTDGHTMLYVFVELNATNYKNSGFFENTFGSQENITAFRRDVVPEYFGYVNGLHSYLYFDFGLYGMCIVWFFFCIIIEYCAYKLIQMFTPLSLIAASIFIKIMQESIVFNTLKICLPFFGWVIIIYCLFRFKVLYLPTNKLE